MTNSNDRSEQFAEADKQPEILPSVHTDLHAKDPSMLSPAEISQILHQLRVYHDELEMRNNELHHVKKQLEISQSRYHDLYDLAPIGYVTLSQQGTVLELNQAAANLLGVTLSQAPGQVFRQFFVPEDQPIFEHHCTQLFHGGQPQTCGLRIVAQPAPIWVRVDAVTSQGSDESVVARIVMSDITQHKREELALKEALAESQRLRDALDYDPSYIYIKDTQSRYIYANKRTLGLFGCSADELLGSDDSRFFPPESVTRLRELDARVLAGEQTAEEVDVPDTGAGRRVYWEVKTPIYSDPEHHNISGLLGISTDITERKHVEEVHAFLAHTSSGTSNEPFFNTLARFLGQNLPIDLVCIARLQPDDQEARTIAVWNQGVFEENMTITIANSPCQHVVGKTECCFPANIRDRFPDDPVLQALNAESYLGITLWGHNSDPIGFISVVSRRPMDNHMYVGHILRLVGMRAAAELERMDAEAVILASEERFRSLFDTAPLGYQSLDEDGHFVEVNQAWLETLGYQREEVMGRWFGDFLAPDYAAAFRERFPIFKAAGKIHSEFLMVHKDGSHRYIAFEGRIGYQPDGVTFKQTHCILSDITEHKQAEIYREMSIDVLRILNETAPLPETIQRVLSSLKSHTGCDAVGIRLHNGEDYPYYVQEGFSKDFLMVENSLVERGPDGGVCRDCNGNINLECTCGLVISGKTDPSHPLMTRGGSFWVNDSFPLLRLTPNEEPRHHPRNTCIHQNYASVALVPIKINETIVGLIQLNDKRKGRFTLETVEIMEGIASHLGSALMRKQAEDELSRSVARFRSYFEMPLHGHAITSADKHWLEVNDQLCTMLGYSVNEFLQLTWEELTYPEDLAADIEQFDRILSGEIDQYKLDKRFIRKDGGIVWSTISVGCVRSQEGKLAYIVCVIDDITARKKAEDELKQSEEWQKTILQTAMDGFLLVDMQGKLLEVNEAYCRMSGYSAQELLSMGISDLEAIDTQDVIEARHHKLVQQGESRFESKHRRKDGTIYDLEVSIKYHSTKEQIVVFYHDITARKKSEAERIALEAQLQQAQKMETVGRLAGGVAHDFNNMLGVIIGHTQMAIEGLDPALPIYDDLSEIRLAAERSAELTRQLLAFARKQTVIPKDLDLNETIEGMLKMLERLIGENVRLAWKPSADLWQVKMDPSQVNQILTNLCVNARDAIADIGQVTIETSNITIDDAYCTDHAGFAPGEFVCLSVSDDGCGMDSDLLAHVFEPFYTTKGVGEGTGLGLSSVYGAVKQNGGFINVYSEPGNGTVFTIYIPRHSASAGLPHEGPSRASAIRGHETILLVEDEPSILRLAKKMLERLGYTVISAATPGEATELARQHSGEINLLLTDVVMPEMNGRDLARNLMSLYPGMRRLFMSGYTSDVIAHQGKLEDGMCFIQKPFSLSELSTMVRRALGE